MPTQKMLGQKMLGQMAAELQGEHNLLNKLPFQSLTDELEERIPALKFKIPIKNNGGS